ncbi:INO80 complex subunit D-like [Abrus precatorius]|uniref:INO80 complex subunit D-like n=1 Tax=Abrus precatorius TaxID=3816 RepID=A0A8B8LUR6_ABRPR|nr:INO80 complex subunit D-like [Abrus precatorius]
MDESGSASSPPRPMVIDGGGHDAALANSRFLTREEVLRRRLRRLKQLSRCYRGHYWALMEELKSKYREYYWTYGKSPFKEDHADSDNENPNGVVSGVGDDIVRCRFGGCKTKAMALTKYCHAHILSDSKQMLYQGCRAVAKNLPTGPSFCNKPVLRSMVPSACPTHYQLGERCLARALRRAGAGAGNTIPPNRKPTLKFHVIASEFVHQIQNKRKVALKDTAPKAETEKETKLIS